ncbi:aminotransferase class I/II-fold pyridoxal phosphate-dependent enzyme [Streptomyces sp. NPDC005573]|uniref:threonine aldolase family protein n=1 Tax=Streptomyces sp. NPDC005573 TaxID=3156890 RepID=UPI0033A0F314
MTGGPSDPRREDFASDNHAEAHPAVLAALLGAAGGPAPAYGGDRWTAAAEAGLRDLAGPGVVPLLVFSATAANVLGLSVLLGPGDAIVCAEHSHLAMDECGAVEAMLGRKLLPVPAPDGKLTPRAIEALLERCTDVRMPRPSVVALTQATEVGTCYTLAELAELREFCDRRGLRVYIDGARLANAVARLGCEVADIARFADALSFGFTKNGALGADALLLMAPGVAERAPYLRRQQGQLASKMRFLAAQVTALLDGGLWLDNARHANGMTDRLAAGLEPLPGLRLTRRVQSNAVFAELPRAAADALRERWAFHLSPAGEARFMTSHATTGADVSDLVAEVGTSLKQEGAQ